MLEALITSKTRIKLLLKFFLNPDNSAYLRGLEHEFGESSNGIRLELNRLEQANMIRGEADGNKKVFKVNQRHPLYGEINSMVRKFTGLDAIVEFITDKMGEPEAVYLTGDLVKGMDAQVIDLIFIGSINENYLVQMLRKTEKIINRKIRYLVYESGKSFVAEPAEMMLLWQRD